MKAKEILDTLVLKVFLDSDPKRYGPGKYVPAKLNKEQLDILRELKSSDIQNIRIK
jgi:hypothetical protein